MLECWYNTIVSETITPEFEMKKRVLPVLLAGLMVLGFSGCQKADPTEILQNAMTKTQSLESVEYDAGLSFDAEISGMRIGMDLDMNLKAINDKENPALAYTMSTSLMGQDVNVDMIYQDGTLYMDSMGYKVKSAIDYDDFIKDNGQIFDLTKLDSEDVKDLTNLEMKMDGDNIIFSFTADEKEGQDLLDAIMQAMERESGGTTEQIKLKSLSGEYTVNKDGYLIGQKIVMSCEMTQDNITSAADITVDMSLVNPGQTVEIKVDDPDSYQEASDNSIDSGIFGDTTGGDDIYTESF